MEGITQNHVPWLAVFKCRLEPARLNLYQRGPAIRDHRVHGMGSGQRFVPPLNRNGYFVARKMRFSTPFRFLRATPTQWFLHDLATVKPPVHQ